MIKIVNVFYELIINLREKTHHALVHF